MSGGTGDVRRTRLPARRSCLCRGASIRAPLGAFLCLLLVALAGGCEDRCVRNSDCPPGYLCQASGMCDVGPLVQPGQPVDGGGADGGAGAGPVEASLAAEESEAAQGSEAAEASGGGASPATHGGDDGVASEHAAARR
ncbi:MAG TPA: hypothetical protein VKB80_10255 [Kofleriaceae bacterium]|nr:hypothetical protein [Kofleriaceae bacterium]